MDIELFSFFSGLGILDLGFENAGFKIEFVDEYNDRFLSAYQYARMAHPHNPKYGYCNEDVRSFLNDEFWNKKFPDYEKNRKRLVGFIGGPPCPDFSVAGKNAGEAGTYGQLTSVYANLIIRRKPDFFVLENVKGLIQTRKHKDFYERIKKDLGCAGYELYDSVENALEYGAPQYRDRLILIGLKRNRLKSYNTFKIGAHKKYSLEEIMKVDWPTTDPFMNMGDLPEPDGIIRELTVQYWFEKNDINHHPNGRDVFAVKNFDKFLTIPEGDTHGKSFKRLHRWRYSPTAAYGNNEVHLHPYLPRRISVAEALAVQSLPSDFTLPENIPLSLKFKMVGNAVPYLLASGIACDLMDWLKHNAEE